MGTQYALPIEMLQKWAKEKPNAVYLSQPVNREYIKFTWAECYDAVRRMATALQSMGFQPGDRIGILSKNCAEWFLADFAIQAAGFVSAPIYYTASADTISYIVDHADVKAVFMGKLDDLAPSEAGIRDGVIKIAFPYKTIDCEYSWKELLKHMSLSRKTRLPSRNWMTCSPLFTPPVPRAIQKALKSAIATSLLVRGLRARLWSCMAMSA